MVTRLRNAGIVIGSNGWFDGSPFNHTAQRLLPGHPRSTPCNSTPFNSTACKLPRVAPAMSRVGTCGRSRLQSPAFESCPRSRPAEESRMAKRSARNTKVVQNHDAKVTSLFDGGWNPLGHGGIGKGGAAGEDREQSYRRTVRPQSDNQRTLVEAMTTHPLTLALGPAGTGKTYLAVSAAVAAMEAGSVGRIVLTRPAVEAGESLGFLPGDLHEKLAP